MTHRQFPIANTTDGTEVGPADGTMTVTLTNQSSTATTVSYTLGAGTATSGSDFTALSLTVVVPANTSTATITIPVLQDTIVEGGETVIVNLTAATSNASITAAGSATNTITDNDTGSLVIDDVTIGEAGGNATFTVTLTGVTQSAFTVTYASSNVSATAGSDYTAVGPTTLNFTGTPTASPQTQTFTVPITDDGLVEGSETATLTLSGLSNTFGGQLSITDATGTLSITDNDTATVSVTASVNGDEGPPTDASITVTQTAAASVDTVITLACAGGTAVGGGTDYTCPASVTITAGTTFTVAPITINDDVIVEAAETFTATIGPITASDPQVTLGAPASANLSIADDDTATVSIAAGTNGSEPGPSNVTFTVTQSAVASVDTVIPVTYGGGAASGVDYTAGPATVTVLAGTTGPVTITLPVIDDLVVEGTETLTATLGVPTSGLATLGTALASRDIADDDTATVAIALSAGGDGTEPGADDGEFTVTMSATSSTPTTVSYTLGAGTATSGADFAALPGSVIIPANSLTAVIAVDVLDDAIVEPIETVIVDLTPATSNTAIIAAGSATANITSDDTATVSIALSAGGDGAEPGADDGEFTVTMSAMSSTPTTVSYTLGAGTATSGADFAALPGSVIIPANSLTAMIAVDVLDDLIVEGAETVIVDLTPATSNASITAAGSATVSIADDDTSTVSIANTTNGTEAGPANGTMTVTMTNQSSTATTVSYTLGAGTATSGTDFTALPLTVVVPALTSSATITIPVLDDVIVEGGETVIVNLTAATSNAAITAAGSATNTIADDDLSNVTIANITDAAEPATDGVIRLTLSNPSATATTVTYTAAGSATAGTDYTALAGTALIPALATTFDIAVTVIDDVIVEGSETVDVTVTNVTGPVTLGATLNALNTIADDDLSNVTVANITDAAEPATNGVIRLTLSNPSATATTVTYTVAGSATAGTDYTALAGTANIPALSTSFDIAVAVIDDVVVEGSETVDVTVTNVTGPVTLGATLNALNTIADNDNATVSIANTVNGDEAGAASGTLTVTQTLASATDTVIALAYGGSATNATDYGRPASVTIPAGLLSATITLTVVDDALVEGAETVDVTISITSGLVAAGAPAIATNTIADNDVADVSISNTLDGAEPATNGSLTVSQTAVSVSDTVVSYTIAGTAAAGGDYVALSGTATILAGQLTATINVTVLNDLAIEASETVIVTLTAVTSGLGTLSAAVAATNTIADDDTAISNAVSNAFKAQTHNFLVRRSDLITSHEPSIYRLANRDKGQFLSGSSGFNIVGENGNLKGDFAMNARSVAHALEVASSGGATISPAADVVDSASAFNAWVEGQFAIYRDDDAGQDQEGDFFVGYAGADWRVNDRVLLGVMGQLDWAEDRQDNSINVVSGTGWMAGPYLSAEPVDNIFVDLRALWGQSDNSAIQEVLGSRYEGGFDTERWLAQAVIAGKHEAGNFSIAPEMSLIYMHENQDSYSVTDGINTVLVGGQSVDLGRLAGGITISYQGDIGDAEIEPFVGSRLLWDFENPGLMTVGGALASRDELRPQFRAGFNIRTNASQLSLEATYDGLGSEGLEALTGKFMLSHSF